MQLDKFRDFSNVLSICEDLKISTMTFTCQLNTDVYIENVGKYVDLRLDGINTVKIKNDMVRSIIPVKLNPKKIKKNKKSFYNQITLKIATPNKKKPVNVKLFENGSIQMTGCICIEDCVYVLEQVCYEFKKVKGILGNNNKITSIHFVKNCDVLDIDKIQDIKIVMINSNYKIGFNINRSELYKALLLDGIDCTFEPCVHACVNIKYTYDENNIISIFVFESGAIIITGAKNKDHIIKAYKLQL